GGDLDSRDKTLVLYGRELNRIRAVDVGRQNELFDNGPVLATRCDENVEVGEHLGSVDAYVERSLARGGPVRLGEVQANEVARALIEAGKRIGEVADASRLIDGHRRWVQDLARVDRIRVRDGTASREIDIGEVG